MSIQILRGSKQEIAEEVARIPGDIHEAIVFVEDSSDAPCHQSEDIFSEMEPFTVRAGGADYSRESLYSRMEGE
jgi:hypothetical protein